MICPVTSYNTTNMICPVTSIQHNKSPQKARGHLKHDFRLTERLLPDSAMTYRGRSDGLMVESDRKKMITFKFTCHLRDLQGYCVYTSGGFFSPSFSPRQCVAPIALMDKPPLEV